MSPWTNIAVWIGESLMAARLCNVGRSDTGKCKMLSASRRVFACFFASVCGRRRLCEVERGRVGSAGVGVEVGVVVVVVVGVAVVGVVVCNEILVVVVC